MSDETVEEVLQECEKKISKLLGGSTEILSHGQDSPFGDDDGDDDDYYYYYYIYTHSFVH